MVVVHLGGVVESVDVEDDQDAVGKKGVDQLAVCVAPRGV